MKMNAALWSRDHLARCSDDTGEYCQLARAILEQEDASRAELQARDLALQTAEAELAKLRDWVENDPRWNERVGEIHDQLGTEVIRATIAQQQAAMLADALRQWSCQRCDGPGCSACNETGIHDRAREALAALSDSGRLVAERMRAAVELAEATACWYDMCDGNQDAFSGAEWVAAMNRMRDTAVAYRAVASAAREAGVGGDAA